MIKTILVPLDGSELSELALGRAKDLAKPGHAQLVLLRIPVSTYSEFDAEVNTPAIQDEIRARDFDDCMAYVEAKAAELGAQGYDCKPLVMSGPPERILCEAADMLHADVIVMSTHDRRGLQRWLHGSVANHVQHHTRVPLELVRSASESLPNDFDQRMTREEVLRNQRDTRILIFWPNIM
jgi:nucleotide-binding universal stress UspA family protein